MELLARAAHDGGAVLAIVHDLALAARFADRIVIMDRGRLVADGAPRDVLTAERIAAVFGVEAFIADDATGTASGPAAAALNPSSCSAQQARRIARLNRSTSVTGGVSGSSSSASRRPILATRPSVTCCTTSAMAPSGTMSPAFGVRTVRAGDEIGKRHRGLLRRDREAVDLRELAERVIAGHEEIAQQQRIRPRRRRHVDKEAVERLRPLGRRQQIDVVALLAAARPRPG